MILTVSVMSMLEKKTTNLALNIDLSQIKYEWCKVQIWNGKQI